MLEYCDPPTILAEWREPQDSWTEAHSAELHAKQELEEALASVRAKLSQEAAVFDSLFLELERIEIDTRHWTREIPPPSEQALHDAHALLIRLKRTGFAPDRIIPSADGGVGMFFRTGTRYADFECSNEGRITAVVSDGHGQVRAFAVESDEYQAIAEIRAFLEP